MVFEVKYHSPKTRGEPIQVEQIHYFESDTMPDMDKVVNNLIALGRKVIKETVVICEHKNTAQYLRRTGLRVPKI